MKEFIRNTTNTLGETSNSKEWKEGRKNSIERNSRLLDFWCSKEN